MRRGQREGGGERRGEWALTWKLSVGLNTPTSCPLHKSSILYPPGELRPRRPRTNSTDWNRERFIQSTLFSFYRIPFHTTQHPLHSFVSWEKEEPTNISIHGISVEYSNWIREISTLRINGSHCFDVHSHISCLKKEDHSLFIISLSLSFYSHWPLIFPFSQEDLDQRR